MPSTEHHWNPVPGDEKRMWEHLLRQRGLDQREFVRLDDGSVVRVGSDAKGEHK